MDKILNAVLEGTPTILKGYTIFTNAMQEMVKQRNALIKDNWSKLENLANNGLGEAYAAYGEISRNIGILQDQSDEANQALSSFLKFHASKKDTSKEFYLEVKKRLLKVRPDISNKWLQALDSLAEGNFEHNVILEGLKKRQVENPHQIASAINATVALAVRSLMALTYAGFYNHNKQISKYPFDAHRDELINVFQTETKKFEDEVEEAVKRLHTDIIHGSSPQSSCGDIIRIIEQSLPAFGRLQATLRLYALSLKNGNMKRASEKVGKIAAKAGDLTRFAFASYASSYYLSLKCKTADIDPKIKKILEPEVKLKYDSTFPNGKKFEIAKIDKAKNGDYVEVGGFVESINTRRESKDKLISKITLLEPLSNSHAEAVGIYVHFRHVGLLEGAYCVLNGTWQSKSKVNSGRPAIEIDKLSINELSKKSWKVRFLDLSDKFLNRWPGGLNMKYGLSPHVSKAKEGESKILGAGEIIFNPFIR